MKSSRRYEDPCGIARAIDCVGERWALLVVRELVFGPKRFADLKRGLPGASPNVLSQRLDELEADGIVRRRQLEPPAATWVYELTERGRELEDVLLALARWGSRVAPIPKGRLSTDALLLALRTTFGGGRLDGTIELGFGRERFHVSATKGVLVVQRGPAASPVAVLDTDAETLRGLVFGGRRLADARDEGTARIEGSSRAVTRFLASFARPVSARIGTGGAR